MLAWIQPSRVSFAVAGGSAVVIRAPARIGHRILVSRKEFLRGSKGASITWDSSRYSLDTYRPSVGSREACDITDGP